MLIAQRVLFGSQYAAVLHPIADGLVSLWAVSKTYPLPSRALSLDLQLEQYQQLLIQKQTEHQLLICKSQLVEKGFLRNKQLYITQTIAEKTLEASELIQIPLNMTQLKHKQQQLALQQDQTEAELQTTVF